MTSDYEKDIADLWSDLFYRKITLKAALERIRRNAQISVVSLNCAPLCNLSCKHCFYGFENLHSRLLTVEDWKKVIDGFLELGVTHFHISGKEPLTSNVTFEILQYLSYYSRGLDLNYGIITNGMLVDKVIPQLLQSGLSYLDFSIDGQKKENDFVRGKGTFEKIISNLELALTKNVAKRVYVSSVAYNNNRKSVVKLIEWLSQQFGVTDFFIQPLEIHGRATRQPTLGLSSKEYLELLNFLLEALEKGSIRNESCVVMFIPPYYMPEILEKSNIVRQSLKQYFQNYSTDIAIGKSKLAFRFDLTNLAFWRSVQITPDGYYLGCCTPLASNRYWEYAVGNVKEESTVTLYHKSLDKMSPLELFYDESLLPYCKERSCFNKCFGGCRTFTHIRTGSWTAPHPSCEKQSNTPFINEEKRR